MGAPLVPGVLLFKSWFPDGFCVLLAPAAALPAWLLTPPLPMPVVPVVLVPGLEEVEEDPVVPVPAPGAPAPAAPPAPPPPCAKAAEPESIKAVAKPIAVSFIGCSCYPLAIGRQTVDAALVPSIFAVRRPRRRD